MLILFALLYHEYVITAGYSHKQIVKMHWTVADDERESAQMVVYLVLGIFVAALGMCVLFRGKHYRRRLYRTNSRSDTALSKTYHAFVSYVSYKPDETFVYRILLPKLEKGMGFRLCVHHRDFTPGAGTFSLWQIPQSHLERLIITICRLPPLALSVILRQREPH